MTTSKSILLTALILAIGFVLVFSCGIPIG